MDDVKVCKRNHTYVSKGRGCEFCARERAKTQREKDPRAYREYLKEWRRKNSHHSREYREANRDRIRQQARVRQLAKYGLTVEEYEKMLLAQQGKCLICQKEPDSKNTKSGVLAVDHCHNSEKVRGLLCDLCNKALGLLADDTNRLSRAIKYLEENK